MVRNPGSAIAGDATGRGAVVRDSVAGNAIGSDDVGARVIAVAGAGSPVVVANPAGSVRHAAVARAANYVAARYCHDRCGHRGCDSSRDRYGHRGCDPSRDCSAVAVADVATVVHVPVTGEFALRAVTANAVRVPATAESAPGAAVRCVATVAAAVAVVPNFAAVPGSRAVAPGDVVPNLAVVPDYYAAAPAGVVPNVVVVALAARCAAGAVPPGLHSGGLLGGFVVPAVAARAQPDFPASAPHRGHACPAHSRNRLRRATGRLSLKTIRFVLSVSRSFKLPFSTDRRERGRRGPVWQPLFHAQIAENPLYPCSLTRRFDSAPNDMGYEISRSLTRTNADPRQSASIRGPIFRLYCERMAIERKA